MKNLLTSLALIASLGTPAFAADTAAPVHKKETEISIALCELYGGIAEYRLTDGARVDCLLAGVAIELDFAKGGHAYECVGQALYYGRETGRAPMCILIWRHTEQPLADFKKYARRTLIASGDVVRVECINTDLAPVDCATGQNLDGDG